MSQFDDLMTMMAARRSIREFLPMPIGATIINALVRAAVTAPSAGNRQDWEFIFVESEKIREKMAASVRRAWNSAANNAESAAIRAEINSYSDNFSWFAHAPAVAVVSTSGVDKTTESLCGGDAVLARSVAGNFASASMATQNFMLAAEAAGLATCCLTGPLLAESSLKRMLGIKRSRDLVCLIALGKPVSSARPEPEERSMENVVRIITD